MIPTRTPVVQETRCGDTKKRRRCTQVRDDDRGVSQGKKTDLGGCRDDDKGKQKPEKRTKYDGKRNGRQRRKPPNSQHSRRYDTCRFSTMVQRQGKNQERRGGWIMAQILGTERWPSGCLSPHAAPHPCRPIHAPLSGHSSKPAL
jgi:hypothetical protein